MTSEQKPLGSEFGAQATQEEVLGGCELSQMIVNDPRQLRGGNK